MVQAKERADREARRATESTRISDFFMIVSDMIRGTSVLVKSYLPTNVPLFSILYGMYTHSLMSVDSSLVDARVPLHPQRGDGGGGLSPNFFL